MSAKQAWVLRSGDVIEYEGEPWYVTRMALTSGPRTWGEVEVLLKHVETGVRFKLYALEDDKFPTVRIRGAKYTAEEWMFLLRGDYEGSVY